MVERTALHQLMLCLTRFKSLWLWGGGGGWVEQKELPEKTVPTSQPSCNGDTHKTKDIKEGEWPVQEGGWAGWLREPGQSWGEGC